MCILIFTTTFVWNISHSKTNSGRYYHVCMYTGLQSTSYSSHTVIKLEFAQEIFKKHSDIKFHENPSSGSWVVPCRQTNRWTRQQTNRWTRQSLTVIFWNFANTPTIKNRPVGAELFRVDRQTDEHDKAWQSFSEILQTRLQLETQALPPLHHNSRWQFLSDLPTIRQVRESMNVPYL